MKGRHNLAALLLDQNRLREAEGLWRAALSHARIGAKAPPEKLEEAFKGVLERDPSNAVVVVVEPSQYCRAIRTPKAS